MRTLTLKIFLRQQLAMLPVVPAAFYLVVLLYSIERSQLILLAEIWGPALLLPTGVVLPLAIIHILTRWAVRQTPGEGAGERLRRILVLPRLVELCTLPAYLLGGAAFTIVVCLKEGRSLVLLFPALLVLLVLVLMASVIQTTATEALLRPMAVEEFELHPVSAITRTGLLWPRQSWYQPYVLTLVLASVLVSFWVIVNSNVQTFLGGVQETLRKGGPELLVAGVPAWEGYLLGGLLRTLLPVLGPVLLFGLVIGMAMARRQRSGTRAVELAIRGLASGHPVLPKWPVTDELGDLAFATAEALGGLRKKAGAIAESAKAVDQVARELAALASRQGAVVVAQYDALRQSELSGEELQKASSLASETARRALVAAGEAEQLGLTGREAVKSSVKQLEVILTHANAMAAQVSRLRERAGRIDRITLLLKDLADQTNMVALNAAIEAMRAGEMGKAFAMVAQEIRRLSDESAVASERAREVLRELEEVVGEVVHLSDAGNSQAASSLALATAHGENLRKLTEVVEGGAASARQIAMSVAKQEKGVDELLAAIASLMGTMGRTVEAMNATEALGLRAERISREVAAAMAGYEWRSPHADPAGLTGQPTTAPS